MRPRLKVQLPVSGGGRGGAVGGAAPAVARGGPGALRTVQRLLHPVSAPLAGDGWRRRQGQRLDVLVLER